MNPPPPASNIADMNVLRSAKFSILTLVLTYPGAEKDRDRWLREYKSTHPLTFYINSDDVKSRLQKAKNEEGGALLSGEAKKVYDFEIHQDVMKTITSILVSPKDYGLDTGLGPEIMVIVNCTSNVDDWLGYKNLGSTILVAKLFRSEKADIIPSSPLTSSSSSSSSSETDESDHLHNPTSTLGSSKKRHRHHHRKHAHMKKYQPPCAGGVVDFSQQGPDVEAELRGMFLNSNERYMQFIFNFIL